MRTPCLSYLGHTENARVLASFSYETRTFSSLFLWLASTHAPGSGPVTRVTTVMSGSPGGTGAAVADSNSPESAGVAASALGGEE